MKGFASTLLLVLASANIALAQNYTIPSCLVSCDTAALTASGCSTTDYLCHCTNANETFSSIVPCATKDSVCGANTTAQLLAFGNFAASVCVPYNVSVPDIATYLTYVNGTNTTSTNGTSTNGTTTINGTTYVSSTPSATTYPSAANRFLALEGGIWTVLLVSLLGAAASEVF